MENDDDNRWVTHLCGLRANGRKVSGYTEYEVFYLNKVVWADAGGFINQEHNVAFVLAARWGNTTRVKTIIPRLTNPMKKFSLVQLMLYDLAAQIIKQKLKYLLFVQLLCRSPRTGLIDLTSPLLWSKWPVVDSEASLLAWIWWLALC